MKDFLVVFLVCLLFLTFVVGGAWWMVYKYHDCKKVGHTVTYCVVDQVIG